MYYVLALPRHTGNIVAARMFRIMMVHVRQRFDLCWTAVYVAVGSALDGKCSTNGILRGSFGRPSPHAWLRGRRVRPSKLCAGPLLLVLLSSPTSGAPQDRTVQLFLKLHTKSPSPTFCDVRWQQQPRGVRKKHKRFFLNRT